MVDTLYLNYSIQTSISFRLFAYSVLLNKLICNDTKHYEGITIPLAQVAYTIFTCGVTQVH